MNLVDLGHGEPIVVLPGIQGRWEWHRPGIEALARRCRVVTFSYADEPRTGAAFDGRSCVDSYCRQVSDALAQAGIKRAALCGISYGGLIAAAFAARNPDMVSALVLASALPPTWKPATRVRMYLRAPRLLMPIFLVASLRLFPEIRAASDGLLGALVTAAGHAWNALTHMFSPTRMARRAALVAAEPLTPEVRRIAVPTRVIVGDDGLDRVVPAGLTLEYLELVPGAEAVRLESTGHLGSVTRPERFAELVAEFVMSSRMTDSRRRLG